MIETQNMFVGRCPKCGKEGALKIAQSSFKGKLRWYESIKCDACGLVTEADGEGFPPTDIRKELLHSGGIWNIKLPELKSKTVVVRILRNSLKLELKEIALITRSVPSTIFAGTKVEVTWLAELLAQAGESPSVEKI